MRVTAAIDGFAHSGRLFPPAHQRLFSMTQSGIIHGKYGCFVIRERTVRDFDNARIYKIPPTLEQVNKFGADTDGTVGFDKK